MYEFMVTLPAHILHLLPRELHGLIWSKLQNTKYVNTNYKLKYQIYFWLLSPLEYTAIIVHRVFCSNKIWVNSLCLDGQVIDTIGLICCCLYWFFLRSALFHPLCFNFDLKYVILKFQPISSMLLEINEKDRMLIFNNLRIRKWQRRVNRPWL